MTAANWAALIPAITALVGAVAGLIAVIKHVSGPAHKNPPKAP